MRSPAARASSRTSFDSSSASLTPISDIDPMLLKRMISRFLLEPNETVKCAGGASRCAERLFSLATIAITARANSHAATSAEIVASCGGWCGEPGADQCRRAMLGGVLPAVW